jgi:hypothetical protein
MQQAREQLAFLGRPAHPGARQYRAYLAPAALEEIMSMLCWGGFGPVDRQQKQPAAKAVWRRSRAQPAGVAGRTVSGSLSPAFSGEGYPRSDCADHQARPASNWWFAQCRRIRPDRQRRQRRRIAQCTGNGGRATAQAEILKQLGTGLYISNLWYLNYSDQPAARLTGMTRFATFWVENGEIRRRSAPCGLTTAPTACWVRSWKH